MRWNNHYAFAGKHAVLSASKHHWSNYDDDKMAFVFGNQLAARRGDQLHELARQAIKLGVKLPRTQKTINMYVNDAIGFRMDPEVMLFSSIYAFGTADTICFRDGMLRIHDLKSGVTPASFRQLEIYVAFFCVEYGVRPHEIGIELRIYQNDEIKIYVPDPDYIVHLMSRLATFEKMRERMEEEADS